MEKARYNTEPFSNLSQPLNNVKPSNFWGSHQEHSGGRLLFIFKFTPGKEEIAFRLILREAVVGHLT